MSYKPSRQLQGAIETAVQNIGKTGGSRDWWGKFWTLIGMMMGEAQGEVVRGLEPDLAVEGEMVVVEGRAMHGSVKDHEKACITQITKEQRLPDTDSERIALLCNSVLLARQHLDLLEKLSKRIPPGIILERIRGIHYRMGNSGEATPQASLTASMSAILDLIRLLEKDEEEDGQE